MSKNQANTNETPDTPPHPDDPEAVWTFRGYHMRPGEFNTALVHFYRAEVTRANLWRNRLDTTTNWAVVTVGASTSLALSSPDMFYGVLILNTLLLTLFLWIEARRYRYYELWSYRIRLMETDFFAAMLVRPFAPGPTWADKLAESLLHPDFPISMWEAFGRRFRRNYMWMFLVLGAAWMLRVFMYPTPATSFQDFIDRAAFGPFPGWLIITIGLVYNGVLFLIGLFTTHLNEASGEILPRWGEYTADFHKLWQHLTQHPQPEQPAPSVRPPTPVAHHKRKHLLAHIVSSQSEGIAARILHEMQRGATVLRGDSTTAQPENKVLMTTVGITEVSYLKGLVKAEDPHAFVIVTPAVDVMAH